MVDAQIQALIEATREQVKYEQDRLETERERLRVEQEELSSEMRRESLIHDILIQISEINRALTQDISPATAETKRILAVVLEIQRILLTTQLRYSENSEQWGDLKRLLDFVNHDININVKGNVDELIGRKS